MRVLILVALATGCGRVHFDPLPDAALGSLAQRAYLKASNTDPGDTFGYSVALSADGSTLAVGARSEASAATGVGGNQGDNSLAGAGAVYVFTRAGNTWRQEAYLKATVPTTQANFGVSVTLSADGSTLAVGAYGETSRAGAVYTFRRSGGVWIPDARLVALDPGANDELGFAIALSSDGATLAIGADFEASAATGIDGNAADNSAPSAGAAYVFTHAGSAWTQAAYLKASNTGAGDRFGVSVALSGDGATLVVGSFDEASAATGIGGNPADDSAPAAGAAYVFTHASGAWTQQAYVKASDAAAGDQFGVAVAMSRDGSTFAVGAYGKSSGAGAAYVFERAGASWLEQASLAASNPDAGDRFGEAVGLSADGSTLAVAADRERSAATGIGGNQADNAATDAGAAYVFSRARSQWTQLAYVKASNTGSPDGFGSSLALSSDAGTLAVGAPDEASRASGIDADQTDNSAASAGAVYVFR